MAGVEVALVGLPNSGKSTLFNAFAGGGAVGRPAHVLDGRDRARRRRRPRSRVSTRWTRVASSQSGKIVPATLAGGRHRRARPRRIARRGARQPVPRQHPQHRRGRPRRCAASTTTSVAHPAGRIDPLDDAETVELELIFADLAAIERRAERVGKAAKGGEAAAVAERDGARRACASGSRTASRRARARSRSPAVARPAHRQAEPLRRQRRRRRRARPGCGRSSAFAARARHRVHPAERQDRGGAARAAARPTPRRSWHDLGIERPALDLVTLAAYRLLDLIPFFTTGPQGDAGVDDPARPERAAGGRPHPLRPRARVHPRRGDRVGPAGRGRARRPRPSGAAGCGSRAATTSSPTATR